VQVESGISRPIGGATTLVGLIGWPVAHSVSPAMHNASFARLGLDWRYVPLPVEAGRVGDAVRGLRALGLRGANVTVPHKQAVIPYLDRLGPAAATIGAVNTITVEHDGALTGDNTDAHGFAADLRAHGVEPAGRRVLVLGAGGAARAVVYGLAEAGAAQITVLNRTPERAAELVADLQPAYPTCALGSGARPGDLSAHAAEAQLIVNCTSLGMSPVIDASPWEDGVPLAPGQVVYDLVYNPPHTRFMAQAAAAGAQAIGGLGMLIWQGALAFERWTGLHAPVDAMRAAAAERFGAGEITLNGPSSGVTVRRATEADAHTLSRLDAPLAAIHHAAHPDYFRPDAYPASAFEEMLAQANTQVYIAEVDGRPAGYVVAEVQRNPESDFNFAHEQVYIRAITVEPAFQRHGCGAALLRAARDLARAEGIHTLTLNTFHFNRKAIAFFERQGFVAYSQKMWLRGI
jgi:shikimate dehydrogenase